MLFVLCHMGRKAYGIEQSVYENMEKFGNNMASETVPSPDSATIQEVFPLLRPDTDVDEFFIEKSGDTVQRTTSGLLAMMKG